MANKLEAKVCLECIGGEITGTIISCMPAQSKAIVYGGLSGQAVGNFGLMDLIAKDMKLEGFLLGTHLATLGLWKLLGLMSQCQKMMASKILKSEVARRISLEDLAGAIPDY